MFIIYNSFAIAVTQRRARDRHPARARAPRAGRSGRCSSSRAALAGLVGSLLGLGFGVLLARGMAGYIGEPDRAASTASPSAPTRSRPSPRLMLLGARDGRRDEHGRGVDSRRATPRASTRSRRCRRASTRCCRPARTGSGGVAALVLGSVVGGAARVRRPVDAGCSTSGFALAMLAALLLSPTAALWLTRALRPVLKLAAAGRGRARGRQPDPGAAPHVGHRGGADAVARARRRARRHRAGQLRLDHRLDGRPRSIPTCSSRPRRA